MKPGIKLAICTNRRLSGNQPSCGNRDAEQLASELEAALQRHGLPIPLERSDCLGHCEQGPTLRLAPMGAFCQIKSTREIPAILCWLERELASL